MKKQILALFAATVFSPACAVVGTGVHWGFDFSTSMTAKSDTVYRMSDIKMESPIPGETLFLSVSRSAFERTPINFGGKIFFDLLPVEFEASLNMGVWQYDGLLTYLSSAESDGTLKYSSQPITIESLGGSEFFGVKKTPYGKLQTDFTVKKTIKKIPVVKPSFGAGVSAHFASPVLSADLVKSALSAGSSVSEMSITDFDLSNTENLKKILSKITDGEKKPKVGMHIAAGIAVKPPVIPVGVYADGKYLILFEEIEPSLGIKTRGFLVNAGIMLAF